MWAEIITDSLKDILIALQRSLLENLYPAAVNDNIIDFSLIVDVSEIARMRAVSALYELHMRMAIAPPMSQYVPTLSSVPLSGNRQDGYGESGVVGQMPGTTMIGNSLVSPNQGLPIYMPAQNQQAVNVGNSQNSNLGSSTSPDLKSSRKLSWFGRRKPPQKSPPSNPSISPGYSGLESAALQRRSQEIDAPSLIAEEGHPNRVTATDSGNIRPACKIERTGMRSSFSSRTLPGPAFALPSPENDYAGFCKGAYYLQAGLHRDGVGLRNNSVAKTGESKYWACHNKKCVFEGPACKKGKEYLFDNTIRELIVEGVPRLRYRWSFLAKSHVAIRSTKSQIYDYRCIFCILQCVTAPVITKIRPFLKHVAEHQKQHLDDWMLWKTLCIKDRIAAKDEFFDINLLPPVVEDKDQQEEDTIDRTYDESAVTKSDEVLLDNNPWQQI